MPKLRLNEHVARMVENCLLVDWISCVRVAQQALERHFYHQVRTQCNRVGLSEFNEGRQPFPPGVYAAPLQADNAEFLTTSGKDGGHDGRARGKSNVLSAKVTLR